ncbi:hypothetical protein HPB47_020760 [Ixodes persulcatus]|uniref:Uncharacterized protein n=1 Tax=Ixodes persulcatus TaxID=34615 RepID=A0AC60QGH7_IXOPE|nr:hypothetical protein HPB47_020760 [Ixodes persulcatus]
MRQSGAGLRDCPGHAPRFSTTAPLLAKFTAADSCQQRSPPGERTVGRPCRSGSSRAEPRRTTVPHLSASDMSSARASSSGVLELNVGGSAYATSLDTAQSCPVLAELAESGPRDSQGRVFVDRDGPLFRFILDFLRSGRLLLPEEFRELARLKAEAEYFKMDTLVACLSATSDLQVPASSLIPFPGQPGYITLGYRGTFAFGRDGLADVKFRKLTRILVCGKVTVCREVFGDSLNESRDPDRGQDDRYTSRFFLKHNSLEQAFDSLQESRFRCVCACGSGTSCGGSGEPLKPGMDSEENRWNHYNEFVFVRP